MRPVELPPILLHLLILFPSKCYFRGYWQQEAFYQHTMEAYLFTSVHLSLFMITVNSAALVEYPTVWSPGGWSWWAGLNSIVHVHIHYRHMPANLFAERQAVKQLAYHLLHIIQVNMRLPYTSLVASLLLQHLTDDGILIGKV